MNGRSGNESLEGVLWCAFKGKIPLLGTSPNTRCQGETRLQITAKNVQAQMWPPGAVIAFLRLSLHLNFDF